MRKGANEPMLALFSYLMAWSMIAIFSLLAVKIVISIFWKRKAEAFEKVLDLVHGPLLLAMVSGLLGTLVISMVMGRKDQTSPIERTFVDAQQFAALEARLSNLENATKTPEIAEKLQLTAIDSRITAIESLLISDAQRLVTLPLIKRDLQAIRDESLTQRDVQRTMQAIIQETANQSRWAIGVLGLGVVGILVNQFLKKPEKDKAVPEVGASTPKP